MGKPRPHQASRSKAVTLNVWQGESDDVLRGRGEVLCFCERVTYCLRSTTRCPVYVRPLRALKTKVIFHALSYSRDAHAASRYYRGLTCLHTYICSTRHPLRLRERLVALWVDVETLCTCQENAGLHKRCRVKEQHPAE